MKIGKQIKSILIGSFTLALISCGGVDQIKIPANVEYRVTGKLENGEVVKIKTREGVTQKIKYLTTSDAQAHVILFPGHSGRLKINNEGVPNTKSGKKEFLVRNMNGFLADGFNAVLIDCPSDNCRENKGMLWGFRDSEEHIEDISYVVAYLKEKNPSLPIWVVGSGRGTESAVQVAILLQSSIKGLVLASSTTESTEFGSAVEDADLELIKIPVLAISHDDDICPYSDPDDQEDIIDDLENSKSTKLVILEDGESLNAAFEHQRCYNKSKHMFYTVEDEAINAIASFIAKHL